MPQVLGWQPRFRAYPKLITIPPKKAQRNSKFTPHLGTKLHLATMFIEGMSSVFTTCDNLL
eukprot:241661-Amphidinium_carterae.1